MLIQVGISVEDVLNKNPLTRKQRRQLIAKLQDEA